MTHCLTPSPTQPLNLSAGPLSPLAPPKPQSRSRCARGPRHPGWGGVNLRPVLRLAFGMAVVLGMSAALEAGAQVRIVRDGGTLVLSWDAPNADLQQADAVDGEWQTLTGQTSPYQVRVMEAKRFYRLVILRPPSNPRTADALPLPAVEEAVARFKTMDPDASFTYFNGHVDGFATRPKGTVPSYASNVLASLGLPLASREPVLLAAPLHTDTHPKPARDLDADLDIALPTLPEAETGRDVSTGNDDPHAPPPPVLPPEETRRQPPQDPQELIPWPRPSPATLALESRAAEPILQNFLAQHTAVFEVAAAEFPTAMRQVDFQVGAFFRKATFEQSYLAGEKLLNGRTLVLFDANWNVVNISRMIATPAKLAVEPLSPSAIPQSQAVLIASQQVFARECAGSPPELVRAELMVDAIRKVRVWDVEMMSGDSECHWRTLIHANSGVVLNTHDLRQFGYTDAKVNRWKYPGGDNFIPQQVISTGIYTRNDRRLEHDFFYVMNDHRCEGDPEVNCAAITAFSSTSCEEAYGTTNGSSYIRATVRTARDFQGYYPAHSSEAFGETHTYFWARQFCQWLKPALDALGVLPDSAAHYHRVVLITGRCDTRAWASSSGFKVTTQGNKGWAGAAIRFPHRGPTDVKRHNDTCEGGACFDTPGNIAHELNHFFLGKYFGVGSSVDCGNSVQLGFTHEGILGTAVPQAFWHYYYGVGYNPPTDKLYFSDSSVGRVHHDEGSRMILENYFCAGEDPDRYSSGRVAGQAMWEIYHGKVIRPTGNINTWRPATDTDFNILAYWAADLQAASTFQDRYEYAKRVMEILDKYSVWPSLGKQHFCEIFQHHSLHWSIPQDYCQ